MNIIRLTTGMLVPCMSVPGKFCLRSTQCTSVCILQLAAVSTDLTPAMCRVPTSTHGIATFLAKADGMLAGLAVADEVRFTRLGVLVL